MSQLLEMVVLVQLGRNKMIVEGKDIYAFVVGCIKVQEENIQHLLKFQNQILQKMKGLKESSEDYKKLKNARKNAKIAISESKEKIEKLENAISIVEAVYSKLGVEFAIDETELNNRIDRIFKEEDENGIQNK